jgi:hypothetical protein
MAAVESPKRWGKERPVMLQFIVLIKPVGIPTEKLTQAPMMHSAIGRSP